MSTYFPPPTLKSLADIKDVVLTNLLNGQIIQYDAALKEWLNETIPTQTHALLDGTANNDTVAHAPVRGDLIIGNSTPKWASLGVGSSGAVLHSNGTDPSWQALVSADIPNLDAAKITTGNFSTSLGGTYSKVLSNFRNPTSLGIQANACTGSPFAITTLGKPHLRVDVTVKGAASAQSNFSVDVDGTLIAVVILPASLPSLTSSCVGTIDSLVAGSHNINVKMSATAADLVEYVGAFEF